MYKMIKHTNNNSISTLIRNIREFPNLRYLNLIIKTYMNSLVLQWLLPLKKKDLNLENNTFHQKP